MFNKYFDKEFVRNIKPKFYFITFDLDRPDKVLGLNKQNKALGIEKWEVRVKGLNWINQCFFGLK